MSNRNQNNANQNNANQNVNDKVISDLAKAIGELAKNVRTLSKDGSATDKERNKRKDSIFETPSIGNESLTQQLSGTAGKFKNAFNKATLDVLPSIKKNITAPLTDIWIKNNPNGFMSKMMKSFADHKAKITEFMQNNIVGRILSSIGTVITGVFGVINDVLGRAFSFVKGLLSQAFNKFMEIQSAVGNLAADIGLSKDQSKGLLLNFTQLTVTAMEFGGGIKDITDMILGFSEVTGKNKIFNDDDVKNIVKIGIGTGLGVANLTKMVAEFNNIGISMRSVFETTEKARVSASRLGINSKKVLDSYSQLVTGLTGFQMKSGLDNMVKLATQATQLRMDLTGVAESMSASFFNPEDAVEAAAKMQVLGGQFAEKFGDAFDIMYKAQMSPEEFNKDLMDMTKGLATKGENGIFYIPPANMQMIREASKALGVDSKMLVNGAIEQGKLADKLGELSKKGIVFKNDEDKQAIANLIEFDKKTGFQIRMADGTIKALDTLNDQNQFNDILEKKKADADAAKSRMNFSERLSNIWNRIQMSFTQVFAHIFDSLTDSGFLNQLDEFANSLIKIIIPSINKLFDPKGGISTTMKDIFEGVTDIVKKVTSIFNGQKSFWEKLKDGFFTLAQEIWKLIGPYLKEGFGKLFEAIGHILPSILGGRSIEAKGLEMQMNAMMENKNIRNLAGGQEGFNELVKKLDKNSGKDTWGGASSDEYNRYKNTVLPVDDALQTPNGRVFRGGKGDIGVLFDQAGLTNNSGGSSGKTEISHSGTITVKSEDGKQITINDLEKIGRYTLASYLESLNYGLKNGNTLQNNEKMPITPISR